MYALVSPSLVDTLNFSTGFTAESLSMHKQSLRKRPAHTYLFVALPLCFQFFPFSLVLREFLGISQPAVVPSRSLSSVARALCFSAGLRFIRGSQRSFYSWATYRRIPLLIMACPSLSWSLLLSRPSAPSFSLCSSSSLSLLVPVKRTPTLSLSPSGGLMLEDLPS